MQLLIKELRTQAPCSYSSSHIMPTILIEGLTSFGTCIVFDTHGIYMYTRISYSHLCNCLYKTLALYLVCILQEVFKSCMGMKPICLGQYFPGSSHQCPSVWFPKEIFTSSSPVPHNRDRESRRIFFCIQALSRSNWCYRWDAHPNLQSRQA